MATIYVGSARIGENGSATGGKDGDQKQTTPASEIDLKGEVSEQIYYVHSKGWIVVRLVDAVKAGSLGDAMRDACSNPNIGYNQNERGDVITEVKKVGSLKKVSTKVNSDCSSLVRACCMSALGFDPGFFTTYDEVNVLLKTGKFVIAGKIMIESERVVYYTYSTSTGKYTRAESVDLYKGDILVTATKGHTVIVTAGPSRVPEKAKDTQASASATSGSSTYYPKCSPRFYSLVDALTAVGCDSNMENRKKIAALNGITNYSGTASQNVQLLSLLKDGKLVKSSTAAKITYYPKCASRFTSIVDALASIGCDPSKENRKKIAALNGISNYSGTAFENVQLLSFLKNGKLVKSKG